MKKTGTATYYQESFPTYSFVDRIRYTISRKWFCKTLVLGFKVPHVASNFDIYIDMLTRDLKVARLKKGFNKK